MFAETDDDDVYKLVTELCRHFLIKQGINDDQIYLSREKNFGRLKKLRSKAYEILLNKTSYAVNRKKTDYDPVCELLKFAFILRTQGKIYEADELEKCISTITELDDDSSKNASIHSTLILLNELKSHECTPKLELQVFDTKKHSQEIPAYEKYSLESLNLMSNRFDPLLMSSSNYKNNSQNTLRFINHLALGNSNLNAVTYPRSEDQSVQSITPTSSNIFRFPIAIQSTTKSNFLSNFLEENKDKLSICKEGIVTEPESPWQCTDIESVSENWDNQDQLCNINEEFDDEIWNKIDINSDVSEYRTWETLGVLEPEKEPPFAVESNISMKKFTKAQYLPIYAFDVKKSTPLREISRDKFIENAKLLLLGVESDCFAYHDVIGFQLIKNVTIPEISAEALDNFCFELIHIGNCYKSLFQLISQNNKSDTFNSDGLIFKALCHSINEILSFYKTSVLLINLKNNGIINFINTVRPLGQLISDIAAICTFNDKSTKDIQKGINILTYIYGQASAITKSDTSLVINSILKSCCEVYFRLLEQWLFEGICEDDYGEFMIKIRPKYLNVKGHRFWTRAFVINPKSVPGFLNDLAELILECGKAVRLLKICDPKNPLCHLFSKCHPVIKVCLSVEMQNEQIKFYEDYYEKGKKAIGESVSFSSVIQQEKNALKHKREVVSLIQSERLLKLKKERENDLKKIAEEKNKLLMILKNQAEESAQRKVRDRDAELLADKILLENILQREEEAKNLEKLKKAETCKYYNELAAESEKIHRRADWRIKRMDLFEERILLLADLRAKDEANLSGIGNTEEINSYFQTPVDENIESMEVDNDTENAKSCVSIESCHVEVNENVEQIEINDENENVEGIETTTTDSNENAVKLSVKFDENIQDCKSTLNTESKLLTECNKPKRPDVLDLKLTDNMTAAERNKLRMLREEFGISPNNNEKTDMVLMNIDTEDRNMNFIQNVFRLEQIGENKSNRIKNMKHRMLDNWDSLCPSKLYGSSIVQKNRTKNMAHQFGLEDELKTEKPTTLTDAQRNRERVMTRSVEHWYDATETFATLDNKSTTNENISQNNARETPMSCTTDHFTHSMNSGSIPFQSCENTPNTEIDSDVNSDEIFKSKESTDETTKKTFPEFCQHNYGFFQSSTGTLSHVNQFSVLTVDDVRMLNSTFLQECFKKSVLIPLEAQSRLVNTAIIKYFLQEHHLLSHLHSLRSYFFLLNGEFAKSLTHSLFKQLHQGSSSSNKLLNPAFWKSILEKAISCSINNNYLNSELLSLEIMNAPAKFDVNNPEILNCVCLNYKISWPINIIFDESVMEQYSKVFKFLLMVGRVLWVLQEEFHILKFERKNAYYEQFHKIHLYRFSMMQFMNALHTYLTCSVLHASWAEFEKDLEHATTLDQFHAAHVIYIKKILSRCMLNQRGEMIFKSLCMTFNIILQFHNRITSHSWTTDKRESVYSNFAVLEEMYNSFCQQRAYMVHVAEKFSTSGYQPHLTHFLHALNINDSYKLNVKKKSKF